MTNRIVKIGCIIALCLAAIVCKAENGVDTMIARYRMFLLQIPSEPANCRHWISSLQNGQWPDIDYNDRERGEWKTKEHLVRLQKLATAWANPASPFFHQQQILQAIHAAMDHWLLHKYKNPNWWHNEIGIPQLMRDIMVLLQPQLSETQWKQALVVLGQLKVNGTGANLAWSADLGLHYAAFTGNYRAMDSCRNLLVNEIKISTKEGVQPDYSFHQHGPRLQNYHYGKSFLTDNTRIAWQLRNTTWAFPENKVIVLAELLLEGDQWMARGSFIAPPVIDRAISRPGYLATGNLAAIAVMLKELLPGWSKELNHAIGGYTGKQELIGAKVFPYADYAAFHNRSYSFFLKTISKRTLTSETKTNSENLKGRLLNGGNTYFVRNGKEYLDLMPVWNWNYLPGSTVAKDSLDIVQTSFNGGVAGNKGMCWAMDYTLAANDKKITAHKYWAAYDNVMICLIAGLNGNVDSIVTVLDQCRLQTQVQWNRPGQNLRNGTHSLGNTHWLFHNGFAYLPMYNAGISLQMGKVAGSWYDINHGHSRDQQHDSVFMPVLQHTSETPDARAGYVVAACNTAAEAQLLYQKPFWNILSNSSSFQAISFNNEIAMCAFFMPDTLTWNKQEIVAEQPCMVLLTSSAITIADPGHLGGSFIIHINNKPYHINVPSTGEAVTIQL